MHMQYNNVELRIKDNYNVQIDNRIITTRCFFFLINGHVHDNEADGNFWFS